MAGVLSLLVKDEVGGGPQAMNFGPGLRTRGGAVGPARWRWTGTVANGAGATALTWDVENEALENNSSYVFYGAVVGRTAGNVTEAYWITGCIERGANAAATAIIGTVTVTSYEENAGAAAAVTADTTNGRPIVTVTQVAAADHKWVAEFEYVKVTS